MDDHAGGGARALRGERGAGSDLPHERRRRLAERRRELGGGAPDRLRDAALQGSHPRGHRHPGRRRVHPRGGGRPVRVREQPRALPFPAPAALHEPAVPQHGDVGRPRDVRRSDDRLRPPGPGERRHDGARPGDPPLDHAAPGDRGLRDGTLHDPGLRRRGGQSRHAGREGRAEEPLEAGVLHRDQRPPGPEPDRRRVQSRRLHELRGLGEGPEQPRRRRRGRRRGSRSSAAGRRPRRGALQYEADQHHGSEGPQRRPRDRRDLRARARRATTRRTSATTRWRRRSTSGSRTLRGGRRTCRSTR